MPQATLRRVPCLPVGSFACFVDADWWAFFTNLAVAFGTLAAVGVAVFETVRSSKRANASDRRAADSAAEAAALEKVQAQTAASSADARRLRVEAEIAKNEHWLRVATDYNDELRAKTIQATLAELRNELDTM